MSSEAGTSMLQAVEALVREVARREVTPRFLKVAHSHKADGSLFTEADAATQTALEAALHPERHGYLYFVSRGDGTSEFSTDLAAHNRAVGKYILKR